MAEIIKDESKLGLIADEIDLRKESKLAQKVIVELKETIRENNLKGLSAPQIGYNVRIFCIRYGNNDIRTYCNPIIARVKGITLSREKCASLPDKQFIRVRHPEISVVFQDPLSKIVEQKLYGAAAVQFQHEQDHLDGLLLSDVALEIDEEFDKATDEERKQVIDAYIDSLDLREKEAKKEVEDNTELKEISDGIEFMTAVSKGEVKLGKVIDLGKKE